MAWQLQCDHQACFASYLIHCIIKTSLLANLWWVNCIFLYFNRICFTLAPLLISSLGLAGSASGTRNGWADLCILAEHHEVCSFLQGTACGLLLNQKTYVNNWGEQSSIYVRKCEVSLLWITYLCILTCCWQRIYFTITWIEMIGDFFSSKWKPVERSWQQTNDAHSSPAFT